MGFNYAREKRLFDAEWKELAAQYEAAGFNSAGIQAMRNFDWELFKQRRTYENHVQPLPDEEIHKSLAEKYLSFTGEYDENGLTGRYDWILTILDPALFYKLDRLSDSDKELLTLLAIDGYTQTEIAEIRHVSKMAISKKIKLIKKALS